MTLRNGATMPTDDLIKRAGMKVAEGDTTAVVELDELAEAVDEVMARCDALTAVVETLVELWDTAGRDDDGEKIVSETLFVALVDAGRNALALGERPPDVNSESSTPVEQ
jgi:hypothetical protein